VNDEPDLSGVWEVEAEPGGSGLTAVIISGKSRSKGRTGWPAFRERQDAEGDDAWSPWCREQALLIEAAGLAPAA